MQTIAILNCIQTNYSNHFKNKIASRHKITRDGLACHWYQSIILPDWLLNKAKDPNMLNDSIPRWISPN